MKEALKEFIQSLPDDKTGLRFFEMPTGSGKTYGAIQFIHDFITNQESFGIKKVIYLTNIKSNLNETYRKLKNSFKDDVETFESNVLKITANLDCIIDNILEINIEDDITKMESFRTLRNDVQLLNQLKDVQDSSFETIESYKKNILTKREKSFRTELEKMISLWKGCDKEVQKIKRIKKDFPWLIKLYPAILTSQRKVLFITTDKFYSGNNPIVAKSYRFSSSSIIKDSLIIIDESDKAKMHLLSHQIKNSTDYQLDLLQVVCSIYKSFVADIKPEDLFIQTNPEEKEKTTRKAFEKTRDVFETTFKEHNLDYQFKLDTNTDTKNFFIFHDFEPMTIFTSEETSSIFIKKDNKQKLNIITKDKKKHTDKLSSLIGDLVGAINYFIKFVSMAADNYMEAKNKDLPLDQQLELENSVSTVLSVFGIEQGSLETLKRIAINTHKLINKKKVKVNDKMFGYDLYEEGFQLFSFLNDNSHDLNTKIMMSFLDDTPEKFLKNLASNTAVACISATASADTVLNNFNLSYLKDSLGDAMSFMPSITIKRLKNEYKKRREKANISIHVNAIDTNSTSLIETFSSNEAEREQLEEILHSYSDISTSKKDPKFYKKCYVKVAIAIRNFILNKKGHVMLVLTPRHLKPAGNNHIYNKETIEKIIEIILKQKSEIDKICILTFSSKNVRLFLENYKNAVKNGNKVLIFSSYSTAGTGQNLQYSIIDEDGISKEVDIDSIYLEKPTNLLSIPQRNMREADLSSLIYENLSLAINHEQTFREAKRFIKKACQVKAQNESEMESISQSYPNYGSDSVNNAGIVIIKQAIGRISRTDDLNNVIHDKFIYLDQEIFNQLSFEGEKNKFNTAEFQMVVEKATLSNRDNSRLSDELIRAINMCDVTRSNVYKLLKKDKDKWFESNVKHYKEIRLFLLRHPTISEEELNKHRDMRQFYLKAPEGKKINSYWFKRNNNGDDYKIEKIAYERFNNAIEASSRYVRLDKFMQIEEIKSYFELPENNYMTTFELNDYIILPNIMDDLYRGVLGEAVGYFIFEQKFKIHLKEIVDLTKFEKFDYCLMENENIYIDFKHWSSSRKDDEEELEKIFVKKKKIGAKAVFIINIFDNNEEDVIYRYNKDENIIIIPWLLTKNPFSTGSTFVERRCETIIKMIKEVLSN